MSEAIAMRVAGMLPFMPNATLGFSPKAILIAAGASTIMSSTRRPSVFTNANWPPIALELPGPTMAPVMPAAIAL